MMKPIINFAHRGASAYCPENTMAAYSKALELGATGIETDVQRTKDGRLVTIHDESLKRTTGLDQLVKDIHFSDLRRLDAGSWKSAAFTSERIPALEELLELIHPTDCMLNIELKNTAVRYEGMEEQVIRMVRDFRMEERIVISSFNHYSLALCKQLAPEIRTGILYSEGLYRPWAYAKTLHADALHAHHMAVLPEWVKEAELEGIVYHPWTVNDEARMEQLVDAGAAGIITDYPDRLNAILRRKGALSP